MDREERRQRRVEREALAAEEADSLGRQRRQRWASEAMYISWEDYVAEPAIACRGCGLPMDDRRGDRPPLLLMDAEERTAYDAEEAAWRDRHPDCRAGRWSVAGSRTLHCTACCPPPPISPKVLARIAAIF